MTDWRFYGRAKEVANLQNGLDFASPPQERRFRALKVLGGRGVGKTQLLREVEKFATPEIPVIMFELPNPTVYDVGVEDVTQQIKDLVGQNGSAPDSLGAKVRRNLAQDHNWQNRYFKFKALLLALLKTGSVVVLDEFHHAEMLGLVSYVRQAIGTASSSLGEYGKLYPGKLILMGSHQQKIDRMFAVDAPLHGSIDETLLLRPWCLKTTMTMAAEQGILATPNRFLTLWTAYGGMPRNWRRYCMDKRYTSLKRIEDDKEWHQAWLEVEATVLTTDRRERWDAKAWVELPTAQRDMLAWIGHNQPRGVTLKQIPNEFGSYAEKLEIMNHLRTWRLVDLNPALGEQAPAKWYITDPITLFQTNIFRDMGQIKDDHQVASVAGTALDKREEELYHARMETLEGETLELLANDWLAVQKGVTWHTVRAHHKHFEGDIDAMATSMGDGPKIVWLGSCKRSAESHDPVQTRTKQDTFMKHLIASAVKEKEESGELLKGAQLKRILFSPTFSPAFRTVYGKEDFITIDIQDMAESFNLDPSHRAETEPNPESVSNSKKEKKPDFPRSGSSF